MAKMIDRINNLKKYYKGTDTEILGFRAIHDELGVILVGEKEDDEFYTFKIFRADKHTGLRHGYIGNDLLTMHKGDTDESMFETMARAAFQVAQC